MQETEKLALLCHNAHGGPLGAVLVVQSDSSREEGPAINYKRTSLYYNNVMC